MVELGDFASIVLAVPVPDLTLCPGGVVRRGAQVERTEQALVGRVCAGSLYDEKGLRPLSRTSSSALYVRMTEVSSDAPDETRMLEPARTHDRVFHNWPPTIKVNRS